MYCPNCAAPIDGVKFCKTCGANVSLVSQALTGELPVEIKEVSVQSTGRRRDRHRGNREPSIENAVTRFITGIGFLIAAFYVCFYFPGGFTWGWSFLFPAFALMGDGVGKYLRLKELQRMQSFQPNTSQNYPPDYISQGQPQTSTPQISAPTTSELVVPSSVTEHTTKHLDASRNKESGI